MSILNRYIDAVKRHLPENIRDDAGDELTNLLEEQLDTERLKHGGKLTDEIIAEHLKQMGHPYKVACQYRDSDGLISEECYPLYKRVLTRTLSVYFIVAVALNLIEMFFHQGSWAITLIPEFFHSIAVTMMFAFLLITVIFHYFGNSLNQFPFLWRWNPKRLPMIDEHWVAISASQTITSIISLVFGLAMVSISQFSFDTDVASVIISESIVALILPLQIIIMVQLSLAVVNLMQSHWTRIKVGLDGILSLGVCALLVWAIFSGQMLDITVTDTTLTEAQRAEAFDFLQWWPGITLRFTLAVIVFMFGRSALQQLMRAWKSKLQMI